MAQTGADMTEYKQVPVEPTEEMIEAFFDEMDRRSFRPTASDVGVKDAAAFYKAMLAAAPQDDGQQFNMAQHLDRHIKFSQATFGPGPRTDGVLDHMQKEIAEVRAAPDDLEEWIDLWMLAMDGAWRCLVGMPTSKRIEVMLEALIAKQEKNEHRKWPDWRTAEPGKAVEHDRTAAPPDDELAQLERKIATEFALHGVLCNEYPDLQDGEWVDVGDMTAYVRYLELLGLLERCHPDNPNLVRIKESE